MDDGLNFKVKDSVRAQLADILTYKVHEKKISFLDVKNLPQPPPKVILGAHTLFFDGALKRATGKVGGGLVLLDPNGEVVKRKQVELSQATSSSNEA